MNAAIPSRRRKSISDGTETTSSYHWNISSPYLKSNHSKDFGITSELDIRKV